MATVNNIFVRLWLTEEIRSTLISHLDDENLCALRITSSQCCELITPTLFARTRLNFTPSSLSRQSRIEALGRIGRHIQHLTFSMPHVASSFLPPLIHPVTGREVTFLYTPHTSLESELSRPKYGNSELGSILTDQYPPIFHAATNVPTFIRFFSHLPNLRHLSVSTPNQDSAHRYRRSVVDYALISLRIALERNYLPYLTKLSLSIHPSALLYLKPTPSIGSSPRSTKLSSSIRKLKICLDTWDFDSDEPSLDHLKLLDTYFRSFSQTLEKVSFTWNHGRGPCPFSLQTDPLFAPSRKSTKLFAEVTSPMSPLPATPTRPPMHFPRLRYLRLRNAAMSSSQVSSLVYSHRQTVREFDFENVELVNDGSWDDALSPLTKGNEGKGEQDSKWRSEQSFSDSGYESMNGSLRSQKSNLDEETGEAWPYLSEGDIVDTITTPPIVNHGEAKPVIIATKLKKRRVKHRRRQHPHNKENDIQATTPVAQVLNKSKSRDLFGALPTASSSRVLFGALPQSTASASTASLSKSRSRPNIRIDTQNLPEHPYASASRNDLFGAIPVAPVSASTSTSKTRIHATIPAHELAREQLQAHIQIPSSPTPTRWPHLSRPRQRSPTSGASARSFSPIGPDSPAVLSPQTSTWKLPLSPLQLEVQRPHTRTGTRSPPPISPSAFFRTFSPPPRSPPNMISMSPPPMNGMLSPMSTYSQESSPKLTRTNSQKSSVSNSPSVASLPILKPSVFNPFVRPKRSPTPAPAPMPLSPILTTTNVVPPTPPTPTPAPLNIRSCRSPPPMQYPISPRSPMPCLPMLQPTTYTTPTGVMRDAAHDEAIAVLAEDVEKRVSALRKAREAVLNRLGKEFPPHPSTTTTTTTTTGPSLAVDRNAAYAAVNHDGNGHGSTHAHAQGGGGLKGFFNRNVLGIGYNQQGRTATPAPVAIRGLDRDGVPRAEVRSQFVPLMIFR